MTYYKYADRQAASVIDWSAISKSLVDTLGAENKRREELKAEIDKKSVEFGQELDNAPQGDYTDANTWMLNAADMGQQTRLMQDRLLKSGQLKLKDYLVQRQNTEGNYKQLYTIAKEYQEEYKVKMERYKTDKSSSAELDLMGTIEGLANFSKTDPYINPTTGVMNLYRKEMIDGVYQKTGDFVSVNSLRNRLKINVDKFQEQTLAEDVKLLGETTISDLRREDGLRRILAVEKTTDPTLRKALEDDPTVGTYLSWEQAKVDEYLANPYSTLSLLTDYVSKTKDGDKFKLTFNEEEFNKDKTGKLYLMKDDGSGILKPTFKKEQEEQVSKLIKDKYRNMIDRKATIDVATEPDIYRPSPAELEYYNDVEEDKKKQKMNINMAGKLFYGDNNDVDAASQYFRGIIPGIADVDRDANGVILKFKDGSERTIKFVDAGNNPLSQEDWLASAVELHGIKDVPSAISQSGYDPSRKYNPSSKGGAKTLIPVNKTAQYEGIIAQKDYDLGSLIKEDDYQGTAERLNAAFGPLGYSFSGRVTGINTDLVDVYHTNSEGNQVLIGTVNIDDGPQLQQFDQLIRSKLKEPIKRDKGNNKKGSLDN